MLAERKRVKLVFVGVNREFVGRVFSRLSEDPLYDYTPQSLASLSGALRSGLEFEDCLFVVHENSIKLDGEHWLRGRNFLVVAADESMSLSLGRMLANGQALGYFPEQADLDTIACSLHSALQITTILKQKNTEITLLTEASRIDELTGLFNMKGFHESLDGELRLCRDGHNGLAVVMLDLDKFKQINDRYDHLIGSELLRQVGDLFKSVMTAHGFDNSARYGGDEFVFSFKASHFTDAQKAMSLLRKNLEESEFYIDSHRIMVTASLGMAWADRFFRGPKIDLLKVADAMLYESKNRGRNQLSSYKLSYPIDLHHIGRPHRIDRDTSCDHDTIAFFDNVDAF